MTSLWDDTTEALDAEKAGRDRAHAIASVNGLVPFVKAAASERGFRDRLATVDSAVLSGVLQATGNTDYVEAARDHLKQEWQRAHAARVLGESLAAKSDVCPKCGSHMDDVKVVGNTLTAKCDNCGWSGSKKKAAKTAAIRWTTDTHMGVGYLAGLADDGTVYEAYYNPNMEPTPCSWVQYGPEGDTGPNSGIARASGFATMEEAVADAQQHAAGAKTAGEGQRIPYKCPNCGNTWVKKSLYGGEHCPKCQTKGEVNWKTSAKMAADFVDPNFKPVKWHVYRQDHTGRGIPIEGTDFTSKEQAEIGIMGLRERERLGKAPDNPFPVAVHYLVGEDANGTRLPYGGEHWKAPLLATKTAGWAILTPDGKPLWGKVHDSEEAARAHFNQVKDRKDDLVPKDISTYKVGPVKTSAKTAGLYCTTHDVWVGDGNRDTHTRDSCHVEQRKTEQAQAAKTAETHAPYHVRQRGDKWVVVNDIDEVKGTHDTEEEAREQQKALYANVPGASEQAEKKSSSLQKGAPFAGYEDFDACVRANQDKDDPEAYCGKIKHETEDKKSSAKTAGNPKMDDPDYAAGFQAGFSDASHQQPFGLANQGQSSNSSFAEGYYDGYDAWEARPRDYVASLADLTDYEILEAEAALATIDLSTLAAFFGDPHERDQRYREKQHQQIVDKRQRRNESEQRVEQGEGRWWSGEDRKTKRRMKERDDFYNDPDARALYGVDDPDGTGDPRRTIQPATSSKHDAFYRTTEGDPMSEPYGRSNAKPEKYVPPPGSVTRHLHPDKSAPGYGGGSEQHMKDLDAEYERRAERERKRGAYTPAEHLERMRQREHAEMAGEEDMERKRKEYWNAHPEEYQRHLRQNAALLKTTSAWHHEDEAHAYEHGRNVGERMAMGQFVDPGEVGSLNYSASWQQGFREASQEDLLAGNADPLGPEAQYIAPDYLRAASLNTTASSTGYTTTASPLHQRLAAPNPVGDNLHGDQEAPDPFALEQARPPRTTRPRVMPPHRPETEFVQPTDFGMPQAPDFSQPTFEQQVAAKVASLAHQVIEDNPHLTMEAARQVAVQALSKHPGIIGTN